MAIWLRRVIQVNFYIVGHEQIQVSITIEVKKCTAGSKAVSRVEEAGFGGNVSKCSIPVVPVETVMTVVGEE